MKNDLEVLRLEDVRKESYKEELQRKQSLFTNQEKIIQELQDQMERYIKELNKSRQMICKSENRFKKLLKDKSEDHAKLIANQQIYQVIIFFSSR